MKIRIIYAVAILVVGAVLRLPVADAAVYVQPPGATPGAASSVEELPERAAPGGLGTIALPGDAAGIAALFERLPATVAGEARAPLPGTGGNDRIVAAYGPDLVGLGPPLALQAIDLASGDFWPADWTAERVVLTLAGGADWMVEAVGRDGDLVWVRWRTTVAIEGDRSGTPAARHALYTLSWGRVGAPWLFGAAGDTPARLDALVAAFVAAATAPVTPGATPA